jgi:formylmethanofuran dehydrogenase subunit C
MIAGSIFVFGMLGERAGAGMKRGSIVAMGKYTAMLPTYRFECRIQPLFVKVYLNQMIQWGISVPVEVLNGFYHRYSGDINALGKGEILIYESPY